MNTTTVGILLVAIGTVARVIWYLYLSPLARQRIPGPKRAAVSNVWDYWVQVRRRRTSTFHDLFERYGPVVRIGPNRVAFRNIDTVRTIYSTHRFRKSSWWNVLTFGGSQNMFSTVDPAYHTRLRRLSGPAFRSDNIRAAGHVLIEEMDVLVSRLRRDCADGGYVNIIQLFPQLTLDILGLAILGVRFDQIASGQEDKFATHLESWMIDKALIQPLPSFIRKLPIPRLQEILAGDPAIAKYVQDLYMQADEKALEGRSSMLATYKAYRDADTGEPVPMSLVVGELGGMFGAGMENTALALIYLVYHLALREDMWKIMRSEVSTVNIKAEDFADTLRGLPYLSAFIREILRVRASSSIFLERLVPAGGVTLDGYFLPAGTQVGSQAYSLHHDERVFPQSHMVDPLRWVRLDHTTGKYVNREDITPEMSSHYAPFSIGVRSCVGKALADLELALIATTIVQNFRIHLHESVTPESMSPVELVVMRPRTHQCLIRFEHFPVD